MSYLTGDSLMVRIRVAFGASIAADPGTWAWTDVTPWWHVPDEVRIGWGRSSGAEQPETSTMSLTLKNTDGRFTAYDPRSPYWPNVRKWTPISFDVDLGDGVGWRNRFSGYVRKWPLTWPGNSGLMALAKLEAVGVLGRLGRGSPPARSPMQRAYRAAQPVAYWPMEDGPAATQIGSDIAGHPPMIVTGPIPEFVEVADQSWGWNPDQALRYGTGRVVDLKAGVSLSAAVPAAVTAATASAWTVLVSALTDTETIPGDVVLMDLATPGGTYVRWQLVQTETPYFGTQLFAYTAAGTRTTVLQDSGVFLGFVQQQLSVWQDGGTIRVRYRDVIEGSTAGTLAGIVSVSVNSGRQTSTASMPFGHLAIFASATTIDELREYRIDPYGIGVYGPAWSHWSEVAHLRLARLCAQDGIPFTTPAVPADMVVRMGRQAAEPSLVLYRQCEEADLGLIYESGFGLGYLPRSARYNAPVTLTIDAAAGQLGTPFEPVDDDQLLRNRWTVERIDGTSATAVDLASVDLQGEIEASASVSLASDAPVADHAGFRLRTTTVPEPRYPAVSLNVSTNRALAASWCACVPGSRVQVVNPPAQNVPGVVDQLVVGAAETYAGRTSWKATLNTVPASPWVAATADGDERVPADGTVLTADITDAATTFQITSTAANGRWGTAADGAEFPLDVLVGGELVRLSAITGTGLTQTATVATGGRGLGGFARAWPAGTPVDVAYPAIVPL
ncbi:hypothetical protein ACIA7R_31310 [Micromonospora chalcea]